MSDDDVRREARAELAGYWTTAVRRPLWWLDPEIADLGLLTMARARHALVTGDLLTKTSAIDAVRAPEWLRADLRGATGPLGSGGGSGRLSPSACARSGAAGA